MKSPWGGSENGKNRYCMVTTEYQCYRLLLIVVEPLCLSLMIGVPEVASKQTPNYTQIQMRHKNTIKFPFRMQFNYYYKIKSSHRNGRSKLSRRPKWKGTNKLVHTSHAWLQNVQQTHGHTHKSLLSLSLYGTLCMVSFTFYTIYDNSCSGLLLSSSKLCVHRRPEATHAIVTLLTCKCVSAVHRLSDNRTNNRTEHTHTQ